MEEEELTGEGAEERGGSYPFLRVPLRPLRLILCESTHTKLAIGALR
jgi:hypothetical protein